MKKFITIGLAIMLIVLSVTGCGINNSSGDKKYSNIKANSKPVGVDEIRLSNRDSYIEISGKIYKNGGDIEKSIIGITFELFDDEKNYICNEYVETRSALSDGGSERFKETIYGYDEDVSDEDLKKYTAKIVNIEEKDAEEAAKERELKSLISDIQEEINWNHNYNKAKVLLDDALAKYPDNTDLKQLQTKIENALAQGSQQ